MTTRQLVENAGSHWIILVVLFVALPLIAWLLGRIHGAGHGGETPWKYIYSILVYLTCITGTFAAVLTGYILFFSNESLLDVNPLVYFLPIASMIATLVFIRQNVDFDAVPGFERLSGLLVMIACSFVVALVVQKTRIWVVFGGTIDRLFILAAAVFALLKWGTYVLFKRRTDPARQPPRFPGTG
jgi:hypothetical protein